MPGTLDNNAVWNTAIWRKTWGDQRGIFLSLAALWIVFPRSTSGSPPRSR